MKIHGTYDVAAPRDRVFAAITDPDALRACIPGCEEMTARENGVYEARVRVLMAGLRGVYTGRAELRDAAPPADFRLVIEGGAAHGGVVGSAHLTLHETDGGTSVVCEGDVEVRGPLAAVSERLVPPVTRSMMNAFFANLREQVAAAPTPAPTEF